MSKRRANKQKKTKPESRGWVGGVVVAVVAFGIVVGGYSLMVRDRGDADAAKVETVDPLVVETSGLDPAVVEVIEEAIQEVKRAPDSGKAWGKLGVVLMGYHFRERARVCFGTARSLDSSEPRWPYYEAGLALPENQVRALELLRVASRLEDGKGDAATLKLANLLAELGQWAAAAEVFQGLLDRDPNHVMASLGLGQVSFSRGSYAECLEFLKVCAVDEHTQKAAASMGAAAQMRLGNLAEAEGLARVAAGYPSDRVWYDAYDAETYVVRRGRRALIEQVQYHLQNRRVDEAMPLIQELLTKYPEASEGWLYLGRVQVLQRNFEGAVLALRQHLELEPRSIDGLSQLGLVEMNQGRLKEAVELFERAIEVKPDSEGVYYNLGLSRLQLEEYDRAVKAFRDAIRCRPSFVEAYMMGADVLVRQEKPQEALAMLRRALEVNPKDGRVLKRLEKLK